MLEVYRSKYVSHYKKDGLCGRRLNIYKFMGVTEREVEVECYHNVDGDVGIVFYPHLTGVLPECTGCIAGACSDLKSKRLVSVRY
jgi:hypothetical protein